MEISFPISFRYSRVLTAQGVTLRFEFPNPPRACRKLGHTRTMPEHRFAPILARVTNTPQRAAHAAIARLDV
jgi:hypothetical protein